MALESPMASAFSHIAIPIVSRCLAGNEKISRRLLWLGLFLSVAPDLDVIAFRFGIPYSSPWGHRGFTHSIFFAILVATVLMPLSNLFRSKKWHLFSFSFVSLISHAMLDALTNGGLGVAFFWPINNERYFFPWSGIEVSPIGVRNFFSVRGLVVLASEFLYVWLPCLLLLAAKKCMTPFRKK